jgi:hypothetical protein
MKKTTTPKNATQKEIVAPKENVNLSKINLDAFAEKLDSFEGKEKKSKKESIYKYPIDFPKTDVNSEKGKNWRNNKRNTMKRFINNILLYAKMKRIEDLTKEIESFKSFYTEFYCLNDYSSSSISNSNKEKEGKELELMLSIIKSTL